MTFDPDAPASGDGLYGLSDPPDRAAVVVFAVPFEATTSYRRGTRAAPEAVRVASMQVDLTDRETGDPWRHGIALVPDDGTIEQLGLDVEGDALAVIAAGGVVDAATAAAAARVNAAGDRLNTIVAERVGAALDRGAIPGVLGGDHAVPFGAIAAAAARVPGLGVLHVDAHADLREAYEGFTWSHASIFWNVRTRLPVGPIVQVGIRDHGDAERRFSDAHADLHTHYQSDLDAALCAGTPWATLVAQMIEPLPQDVWISFDIDGLDPSLCPTTGTPVPGGLTWAHAMWLLRALSSSGRRIVGFDLCEVGPGDWDAVVGARLLYKLAGHALRTRPTTDP